MSVGDTVKGGASRGASYVMASSGRQTAFLLIMAIFAARLLLTNQLQTFWGTLWGQSRPLGQALPKHVTSGSSSGASSAPPGASSNGGGSAGGFSLLKPPPPGSSNIRTL
jgi:hypothetical protein